MHEICLQFELLMSVSTPFITARNMTRSKTKSAINRSFSLEELDLNVTATLKRN